MQADQSINFSFPDDVCRSTLCQESTKGKKFQNSKYKIAVRCKEVITNKSSTWIDVRRFIPVLPNFVAQSNRYSTCGTGTAMRRVMIEPLRKKQLMNIC